MDSKKKKKYLQELSKGQLKPLTNIQVTFYFIFYLPFGVSLLILVFFFKPVKYTITQDRKYVHSKYRIKAIEDIHNI